MSGQQWTLDTPEKLANFNEFVRGMILRGKKPTVEFITTTGTRTPTQNNAVHLWLSLLAQSLNDAGFDMRLTLDQEAEIPWTKDSAKERLWKPVQEAMTGKKSTTEADKLEYSDVYEALCRHLASRLPGFVPPPWPTKEAA